MFIFDGLQGKDFSNEFVAEMDSAYFAFVGVQDFNSDALLGYFYFM